MHARVMEPDERVDDDIAHRKKVDSFFHATYYTTEWSVRTARSNNRSGRYCMSAFPKLANAPMHEFLELEKYPGSTFYKFPYDDCPGLARPKRPLVPWVLGWVDRPIEEGSSVLRSILRPCHLESRDLNLKGYVSHARAFIVPERMLVVALEQRGGLLTINRPEKTNHILPKAGLKLLKPNGDGITLRL